MTRFFKLTVCCAFLLLCLATTAFAQEKLRAVIIDGQNNHDWKATTPYLVKILEASGRFDVDVATTPPQGEDVSGFNVDFNKYDVVVMNYNGARWNPEMEKAFVSYIANGGGLLSYHAGNNAFTDWPAYNEMIALGGWGGRNHDSGPYLYLDNDGKVVIDPVQEGPSGDHGPQWAFPIDVRAPEHPIMKGLPLRFRHCQDELYQYQRGPAHNVTVLASAFAPQDRRGSNRNEPLILTVPYGKGRCVNNMLAHGPEALTSVDSIVLLQRCAEWAATGEVTIPVPDNFPGEDEPVFNDLLAK
ncbi:MAG: ThuA domain-containing protein [Thermoguttaceae bacterium]|nr:ThuA domain-containing protein [Thermoguttaceae bacterium]